MNIIEAINRLDTAGYNHCQSLTAKEQLELEDARSEKILEICDAVETAIRTRKIKFSDIFEESFEFVDYVAWVLSGAPFELSAPYLGYEKDEAHIMIQDRFDEELDRFAKWLLEAGDTTYTIKIKRKLGL